MKNKLIFLMLSGMLASTGCATGTYLVAASSQPDQKWHFQHLNAFKADKFVRVSGRLTARLPTGLPRGHIDVEAYSSSGNLLAETTTDYLPSVLTHTMKKKGGVRFSATLDEAIPSDAMIKVAFHREEPAVKIKPTHSGNIAR